MIACLKIFLRHFRLILRDNKTSAGEYSCLLAICLQAADLLDLPNADRRVCQVSKYRPSILTNCQLIATVSSTDSKQNVMLSICTLSYRSLTICAHREDSQTMNVLRSYYTLIWQWGYYDQLTATLYYRSYSVITNNLFTIGLVSWINLSILDFFEA